MDANQSGTNLRRSVAEPACIDIIEEDDEFPMETIDIENDMATIVALHNLQVAMQIAKEKNAKVCGCFKPPKPQKGEPYTCDTGPFLCWVAIIVVSILLCFCYAGAEKAKARSMHRWATPFEMHLDSSNSTIPNIDFQYSRVFTKLSGIKVQAQCRAKCNDAVAFVFISELAQEADDVDTTTTVNCICYLEDSFTMCNHTNLVPFESATLISLVPLSEDDC
jgi:hypothetical protein